MLTGTPLDISLGGTDLLVFWGYMLQETGFLTTPGALPSLGLAVMQKRKRVTRRIRSGLVLLWARTENPHRAIRGECQTYLPYFNESVTKDNLPE